MPVRNELKARRIKLRMTQRDVADQVGVTAQFYGMIEVGKRTPRLGMAFEIAKIMRAKVQDLFPDVIPSDTRTGSSNG